MSLHRVVADHRRGSCRRVDGRRAAAAAAAAAAGAAAGAKHLVQQDATEALTDQTVDDNIDCRVENQQHVAGNVSVAQLDEVDVDGDGC